jgi:stress-induced morphogen
VIEPSEIQARLRAAFPDAEIELEDLTGTKDHYQARIVSDAFSGKTPVEQHQLVYGALKEEMKGPIHALALRTYTKEAWARVTPPTTPGT